MPVCTYVLKPGLLISNLYGPLGKLNTENLPSDPLVAARTKPVSVNCEVAADCAHSPAQQIIERTKIAVERDFMVTP
jgi:hypothetical protein